MDKSNKYLGPWGSDGYPIGYGKKYNIPFTTNRKLQSDPVVREWVRRTTITLQEMLRDVIVAQYRAGKLAQLSEAELRQAAFDSHPIAYTQGELTLVVITAPGLLFTIKEIPQAEFDENPPNYQASKKQYWETVGLVAPRVVGSVLAGLAGPAHTGIFRPAMDRDRLEFQQWQQLGRWLASPHFSHFPATRRPSPCLAASDRTI